MIYIASPYTHDDTEVMQRRYEAVLRYCAHKTQHRVVIYSPIVHFHEMAKHFSLPRDIHYWREANMTMLRISKHMEVLKLPGWEDSEGISDELEATEMLYLHVEWIDGTEWWAASEVALTQ